MKFHVIALDNVINDSQLAPRLFISGKIDSSPSRNGNYVSIAIKCVYVFYYVSFYSKALQVISRTILHNICKLEFVVSKLNISCLYEC